MHSVIKETSKKQLHLFRKRVNVSLSVSFSCLLYSKTLSDWLFMYIFYITPTSLIIREELNKNTHLWGETA